MYKRFVPKAIRARIRAYLIRKLKVLGKPLGARLVDANKPPELLWVLSRYRGGGEIAEISLEHRFLAFILNHFPASQAELYQDLFVLFQTGKARAGYFVEIGASDGVAGSNTRLLEETYGWSGILVEPARVWHPALRANRRCAIDTRCVWRRSGERLDFHEAPDASLSTLSAFIDADHHAQTRRGGTTYPVETVSLHDLLRTHGAPPVIDYLSVDTEGSELAILESFDFSQFDVRVVTVEHNYTPNRERLQALLAARGYTRLLETLTYQDDWYVKRD